MPKEDDKPKFGSVSKEPFTKPGITPENDQFYRRDSRVIEWAPLPKKARRDRHVFWIELRAEMMERARTHPDDWAVLEDRNLQWALEVDEFGRPRSRKFIDQEISQRMRLIRKELNSVNTASVFTVVSRAGRIYAQYDGPDL